MPAGGRFGPQALANPFAHAQQQHLQQHHQHHGPSSAGLPPPTFNSHGAFPQASQHLSMNSFGNHSGGLAPGFGSNGTLIAGGTGLGSEAAQMGFRHGANLQQQQAMRRGNNQGKQGPKSRVRDVWSGNLAQEMQNLRELVEKYPYISMDTEFPGIVARPMGRFSGKTDYHYQCLRTNVDILSILQLGITLFDENGDTPPPHPEHGPYQNSSMPCPHTWQFNFRFNTETDMYNEESIKFLEGVGMNMHQHDKEGIDPTEFGAAMITSGLALFDEVRWISFHAAYDFAYLVKLMYCKPLPDNEEDYRKLLTIYFPAIYDIKYITKSAQRTHMVNGDTPLSQAATQILTSLGPRSSLQDLADELNVKRIGQAHTAGSDSHLTGRIFWDFKRIVLDGAIDDDKYLGQVWGLNGLSSLHSLPNANGADDGHRTPNLNGATIYNNGTPSTPGTSHTNLAQTPNNQAHTRGIGAMTPGGGGGAFGQWLK